MYLQLLFFSLSATITLGGNCGSGQPTTPGPCRNQPLPNPVEKVKKLRIEIYYQALCPLSRFVYAHHIKPVVQLLKKYVDLHTYPYIVSSESFGTIKFQCQHGPRECYAAKLHVCAIENLGNITGVLFNACMMDEDKGEYGSNDPAAYACGRQLSANSKAIINCAKGDQGALILNRYAQLEADGRPIPDYVPYVLINAKEATKYGQQLFIDVCDALGKKPAVCDNLDDY